MKKHVLEGTKFHEQREDGSLVFIKPGKPGQPGEVVIHYAGTGSAFEWHVFSTDVRGAHVLSIYRIDERGIVDGEEPFAVRFRHDHPEDWIGVPESGF